VSALDQIAQWPVPTAAAAYLDSRGDVHTVGDTSHRFRLASISKMFVGWCALIAVEEGILTLDEPVDINACTLRQLLSHAAGYAFDGEQPIASPQTRRIYSNTGIEHAANALAVASGMPFAHYLREAVLEPLGMHATDLRGSPAFGMWSTVDDLVSFARELRSPQLVHHTSATEFTTCQFPTLSGLVPGVGRFDPCPWGLGTELRGTKSPHWTGTQNSPTTYGHFGGAGTLMWVDTGANVACIALTDRMFDEWSADALALWPKLSDDVLAEARHGVTSA
jgi:CubicO group peptidase (beta-lactamase class C family)